MKKKNKQPWPTKAVMNQIYDQHLWGGKEFDFYSGQGSHDSKIITPYLEAVTSFLNSHDNVLTVCDLGCGDFNIGKHLHPYTNSYIAIDIVEDLINRNRSKFKAQNLVFQCLDISKDQLPKTDCVIIRQVLQHLSNEDILNVVKKLMPYKYVILTEHIPMGKFTPNVDIISGQGIRLKHKSGVDLLEAPFHLKVQKKSTLNIIILEENKGQIVTTLYNL